MKVFKIGEPKLSIQQAILFGLILFTGYSTQRTIPLVDWHSDFMQVPMIWILKFVLICLVIWGGQWGKNRAAPLVGLSIILIIFTFKYSRIGAFVPVFGLVLAYQIFLYKASTFIKRKTAQLMLFSIFILSAIQKMNSSYLNGFEFNPQTTTFLAIFYKQWPTSFVAHFLQTTPWLPTFSVITEMFLAFLFLIKPRWAIVGSLTFLLSLTALHKHVHYVFLLLVPLILDLDPKLSRWAHSLRFSFVFRQMFFWLFLYWLWDSIPETTTGYFMLHLPVLVLLGLGSLALVQHLGWSKVRHNLRLSNYLHKNVLATLATVYIYFILSFFILPSPSGFSMFSGQKFKIKSKDLIIESSLACKDILDLKMFIYSYVADVAVVSLSPTSCLVAFPTVSGLSYLQKKVCVLDDQSKFILRSHNKTFLDINCSQRLALLTGSK